MKISLKWVEQFTTLELSRDELVRRIGEQLGAIDEVEDWGAYFDDAIVVAEILEAGEHPDADKLGLYKVKINDDGELRDLVAGDKTLSTGDKVGYIPPGVHVPSSLKAGEPFEIAERKIRGKTSQGMLGSAKELLFSDQHTQVLKLDTEATVGTSLKEAYELDDLIVDVENKMFTHRPDLFGVLGAAREIAGIQNIAFTSPDWYRPDVELPEATDGDLPLDVQIDEPELCPRFAAVTMADVKIRSSPHIVQTYLTRVGMRPINNVVDMTNFYMHLTAQPTHAFDYDKVAAFSTGGKARLVVRKAEKDEQLVLLDGKTISLNEEALVVATDQKALSVGGCIGGAESEVDNYTKNIIIEAASWDLYSIRRTSFAHGIFTDAVTRFNKGQSSEQNQIAIKLISEHLIETGSAKMASGLIDVSSGRHTEKTIKTNADYINRRLGSDFSAKSIAKTLNNTEIRANDDDETITAIVPFWRMDLSIAEDLVEEVGRLHGYNSLPVNLPIRESRAVTRSSELRTKQQIVEAAALAGAQEIYTYNFVPRKLLERSGFSQAMIDTAYVIRNSLSPELEIMRLSLLPSVIDKVDQNIRAGRDTFALFELNKSHSKNAVGEDGLPAEATSLALVVTSADRQKGSAYYRAKAYVDFVLRQLGLEAQYRSVTDSDKTSMLNRSSATLLSDKRMAAVEVDGRCIGMVGEFSQATKNNFKLPEYTAGFEIDVSSLTPRRPEYQKLSRFPSSSQDITLEVPDQLEHGEVLSSLHRLLDSELYMLSLKTVSVYRQDGGRRRISFRATFTPHDQTLKTANINDSIELAGTKLAELGIVRI